MAKSHCLIVIEGIVVYISKYTNIYIYIYIYIYYMYVYVCIYTYMHIVYIYLILRILKLDKLNHLIIFSI